MAIIHVDRSDVRSVAELPSPPGFRFHPQDEELVRYILTKKQDSKPFQFPSIIELDIYKIDPWDLPEIEFCGKEEWHFVSPQNRKYPTSLRSKRATASGYWNPQGKDKPIFVSRGGPGGDDEVGVKKTLVFYRGRAPRGEKTNWMMHEYRLAEGVAPSAHHHRRGSLRPVDNRVLCRIFKNSNHAQREDDMESISALLPKIYDPGFHNWLGGADSAAQQEALVEGFLADNTWGNGRQMSTSLPMVQNRGESSVLELQTSATLSNVWELQQAMAITSSLNLGKTRFFQELGAGQTLNNTSSIHTQFHQFPQRSYNSYTDLVEKCNSMPKGRSLISDEESQSTFESSVYGIKSMYPALDYNHHADHSTASCATLGSNRNLVLPSKTISVTTNEDELNSKTLMNSESRLSMTVSAYSTGSQTSSILMETVSHVLWKQMPLLDSAVIDSMLQISERMLHMLSQRIVHRDLKAKNILVEEAHVPELCKETLQGFMVPELCKETLQGFMVVKLADFGMAKMKCEVTAHSHMMLDQGTRWWRAPEVVKSNACKDEHYPLTADVYSYSMVCYEILTGYAPFQNKSLRPKLPENCPESLASLLRECWHTDPTRRPTFAEISTTLRCLKGDRQLMRGYEKLLGLYWGKGSWFNSSSCLAKVSATVNGAGNHDSGGIMTCQSSTQFVGFVSPEGLAHLVYGINEHRRQADKVNVDAKLNGEPATALKAMGKRSSLRSHFKAQPMTALSQSTFNWAGILNAEMVNWEIREAMDKMREARLYLHDAPSTIKIPLSASFACSLPVSLFYMVGTSTNILLESDVWRDGPNMKQRNCLFGVSSAGHGTARPNPMAVTEDGKTVTAVEELRMAGIEKPFELHDFEPARKRFRIRDWSAEEVRTMLELVEEALRVDVGPDVWDFVSDNLWEKYGFDRASNSCENLWGTLLQSYKATRDHDDIRASTGCELECREKIGSILTLLPFEDSRNIQMDSGLPSSALLLCQFQSSASDMGYSDSADCDKVLYYKFTDEEMEEVDTHSDDEGLSDDSTATIESQAEVTADSHASRITEPCYETNSNYSDRKRSAARVMEDDLISRIAPFVNKQIEDALKPLLSVLRRGEDEQKHREKLVALEEEKLALKREKMQFTRRVVDQHKINCTSTLSSGSLQKKPIL